MQAFTLNGGEGLQSLKENSGFRQDTASAVP
jgi:hypothetical protein